MKVTMISHTDRPLRAICIGIAAMKEKDPIGFVDAMTTEQQEKYCDEIFKTKLKGVLEFAHFEFFVEGVTRAFTHQLVRHRTMSFSQQSMRFFDATQSGFRLPDTDGTTSNHQAIMNATFNHIVENYKTLLDMGCPIEDARSILPTNVLTAISFSSNFRGLYDMAEVRLCLQTQAEFREVMLAIKAEVKKVSPYLAYKLKIICQHTGECAFESMFDRDCPIKADLAKKKGL